MSIKRIMSFGKNRLIFGCTDGEYAVHFWIEGAFDEIERPFGGIEFHWPKPAYQGQVSRSKCWITGKLCYHDGSSTMADERFIPLFRMCNEDGDFEPLFQKLERLLHDIVKEPTQ